MVTGLRPRNIKHFTFLFLGGVLIIPQLYLLLFDGQNISFDASLVIYINSTNIPPIMIINRTYETRNLLSLWLVSFLVGLRTYQHPCTINLWAQSNGAKIAKFNGQGYMHSVVCESYMSMEHCWSDTERERLKNSEKSLTLCYFVHHKISHESPWARNQTSAGTGWRLPF